jgi:hypothetical protein
MAITPLDPCFITCLSTFAGILMSGLIKAYIYYRIDIGLCIDIDELGSIDIPRTK